MKKKVLRVVITMDMELGEKAKIDQLHIEGVEYQTLIEGLEFDVTLEDSDYGDGGQEEVGSGGYI